MRILVLAALSSCMISCATFKSMTGQSDATASSDAPAIVDVQQQGEVDPPELNQTDISSAHQEVSQSYQTSAPQEVAPVSIDEPRKAMAPKAKAKTKPLVKSAKQSPKKVVKNSKPSKKELAASKNKKSAKSVAKKPKVDCKKIAKLGKKAKKQDVAFCKAEKKRKVASRN